MLNFLSLFLSDIFEVLSPGGVEGVCMEALQRFQEASFGAQSLTQAFGNEGEFPNFSQVEVFWQIRGRGCGGEEEIRS